MRILYLCCDPGIPVFGRKGASSHVRGTCVALANAGHEVRLVCSNSEGDQQGRNSFETITVAAPESKKLGFDLRRIILDRRFAKAVEQLLATGWMPEAIYERYCLYSLTGTRLSRKLALPHILEINAFLSEEMADRLRIKRLALWFERRIIRRANEIFVVSAPLKEGVDAITGGRIPVTIEPMSVDLDRFSNQIDGRPLRKELGIDGKFVVGYVGTLSGWHGIRLLYDIAEELKRRSIDDFAILVVGGEGDKLEKHRTLAKERNLQDVILFHGAVAHSEVPLFIRAMDVGLIPDANPWNAPTKLFEYQACGIPAVGPDYSGVRSSMDDPLEGFIFPPKNVKALVDCIERLYRNREQGAEMGAKARERVARTRSWKRAAKQIIGSFENQTLAKSVSPKADSSSRAD